MIGIFQGRGIADRARLHAQIDVDLRQYLYVFNNGRNLNPLGVFLCIALHADKGGWAWPGRELIKRETGITTEQALTGALAHLRQVEIMGERIFAHYRAKDPDNKRWGRSAYLIFPEIESGEPPFKNLLEYDPSHDDPSLDHAAIDDPTHEVEPSKEEPSKEISGSSSSGDSPPSITTAEPVGDAALEPFFGPRPKREPTGATGNWADPASAGGADPVAEALADKICRFNGLSGFETLPEKKRTQWVHKLSKMLAQWGGATADELRLAWSAWREAYGWHDRCNPFYPSFEGEFGPLLAQVQEEGQRKGKPKVVSWRDDERWEGVGDGPMVVRAKQ